MSEGQPGVAAVTGADARERVVLARSAHTLRLVDALDHVRSTLRAPPAEDFTEALSGKLGENAGRAGTEVSQPAAPAQTNDAPRLDFLRTSILRGHVSQPGDFNPDPNTAPLPELPRERDTAEGPAPDVVRADEIAALSAMLKADHAALERPPIDALLRSETNLLPPDVLQDLRERHLAREARGHTGNGWPAPESLNEEEDGR